MIYSMLKDKPLVGDTLLRGAQRTRSYIVFTGMIYPYTNALDSLIVGLL